MKCDCCGHEFAPEPVSSNREKMIAVLEMVLKLHLVKNTYSRDRVQAVKDWITESSKHSGRDPGVAAHAFLSDMLKEFFEEYKDSIQ